MIGIAEDTITAAVSGDTDAVGRLLVAVDPELRRHIVGKIGKVYRAALSDDDVIQVTFVEAYLRIGQLVTLSVEAFTAWLKRIADRNLIDAIRELDCDKRPPRRRQVVSVESNDSYTTLLATLGSTGTSPTQGASREEIRAIMDRAISQLPTDYAKVMRLYDLQERSIDEVAAAFDPPRNRGAIHMLRARAHDRLHELLGDTAQFFSDGA
ncbi:MAG: sigma-70 family RNA polymerase sigma factor [Phycisphaerales bacterium]|nr:sigma-70 family RNA polymerase sigma factor [Phycisphaerales bacterium]